jgi:hypothetical protein
VNPMSLVRLLVCLAVAWTITAIGYNALKERNPPAARVFFVPKPSFLDATESGKANRRAMGAPMLVDRRTGRQAPIELPHDLGWDLLSVSPWLDQEGRAEAVARWANRAPEGSTEPFCGLGLLKLPEAKVVGRIATDVLPTGRACFVPGHAGEILFPAGDGQLYRCTLRADSDGDSTEDTAGHLGEGSRALAGVRALVWECPTPTSGNMLLTDPAWSSDPRLRHLVFVSFTSQREQGPRHFFEPAKLWWLEVDEHGETIRRAGPLSVLSGKDRIAISPAERGVKPAAQRYPTVVVSRSGVLGLVYLSQRLGRSPVEVWWVPLSVDHQSGVPCAGSSERLIAETETALLLSPPVIAADGRSVLAPSRAGALVRLEIPGAG